MSTHCFVTLPHVQFFPCSVNIYNLTLPHVLFFPYSANIYYNHQIDEATNREIDFPGNSLCLVSIKNVFLTLQGSSSGLHATAICTNNNSVALASNISCASPIWYAKLGLFTTLQKLQWTQMWGKVYKSLGGSMIHR